MKLSEFVKLLEKFETASKYKNTYTEIYRNPSSKEIKDILKDFKEKMLRGVVRNDGEIFVLSNEEMIHDNIVKFLVKNDLLDDYDFWYMEEESLKKFLCVDRKDNGIWKSAESYSFDIPKEYFLKYKKQMESKGYKIKE